MVLLQTKSQPYNNMHLSSIEYNVIMQAINNAYDALDEDTFIDPYGNEDDYTNDTLRAALENVERKILDANIPR